VKKSPYSRFCNNDLILRDELAVDRTLLANERTLLAYLRSGAALLIAGVSIMHFSTQNWFWAIGIACIPAGIITEGDAAGMFSFVRPLVEPLAYVVSQGPGEVLRERAQHLGEQLSLSCRIIDILGHFTKGSNI